MPEGMTAHKTFALDVPLRSDSKSRIKAGTAKSEPLIKADAFFLDESPMLPRYGMENINDKLCELRRNTNVPFGGAVMVFGGDFRQCLPVQPRANQTELRSLSIKRSSIWTAFLNYRLTSNMRVDPAEAEFKQWLLDGTIETDDNDRISIPAVILSNCNLVEEVLGP